MSDLNHRFRSRLFLLTLWLFLLCVNGVFAYAGPGAGLELVAYFMSLLVWVGTAFLAIFMYPIYALIKRIRGGKKPVPGASAASPAPVPQASETAPQTITAQAPTPSPVVSNPN